MKNGFAITRLSSLTGTNCFRGMCAFALLICFGQGAVSAQQAKKNDGKVPIEDATRATNQQEIIARLFGVVNELKSESDRSATALLQSEIADVLWRFDEPAARSIFRLAFDTVRQTSLNNSSSIDAKAKREALTQSRRRISALKTVLKRYGLHDRKGAEAWLKEFEDEIKTERKASENGKMSQEQADLLAEMALGLVSGDPKEAQRLGLLSLAAEEIPAAFDRLLIALRGKDKTLSDVLFRQAILTMTTRGFNYQASRLSTLANYEFFADGRPFPDVAPADVGLLIQYFVDAASAQAARWRSGNVRDGDEQISLGRFYSFLTSRAMPIVARISPDKLALLQSNVGELAQRLSADQRQQAEMLASLSEQRSAPLDGNDSDIESRIHRAEQEKNSSTRNLLLRNLVLGLCAATRNRRWKLPRRLTTRRCVVKRKTMFTWS